MRLDLPRAFIHAALLSFATLCMVSCGGHDDQKVSAAMRNMVDSTVRVAGAGNAYDSLYHSMASSGNTLGAIVTLREWGKSLRDESRFDEALRKHNEGRKLAELACDTLEWGKALNNMGTDYRRMGILDLAQRYHYIAWTISQAFDDTSSVARKNRVVSLNGLANVYLTLGNLDRADSALRIALAGETALRSELGQAINYANIGSIFEAREQNDSALFYYRKSMAKNKLVGNTVGMSLCHTSFGNLYKKVGEYDKALVEYEKAYKLMENSLDEWHTIKPLVALANIYLDKGNDDSTRFYLDKAQGLAEGIKSNEYLSDIYALRYRLSKQRGDYGSALAYYERSKALQDSLVNMEKMNRMQNTSLAIERTWHEQVVSKAQTELDNEKLLRRMWFGIFGISVTFLVGIIGVLFYAWRERMRSFKAEKKVSVMRENFFTNITHEFRTPLTLILGLGHDLQQPELPSDKANKMGRMVERQGRGLLKLVNQLLDIAKVKSAVGEPEWREGNVVAYIAMAVESFRDYARRREIDLRFYAVEPEVYTDFVPAYMNKVLGNLMSNAIKFTPAGGSVSVSVSSDGVNLCIKVKDTGVGISEDNVGQVFEPFYQAACGITTMGSGVGLSLVKHIVDNLDGSITLDSKVGHGTTFTVVLPLRHTKAMPLEKEESMGIGEDVIRILEADSGDNGNTADGTVESADGTIGVKRVLVVEDNNDVAAYIGSKLCGIYAVYYAKDGRKGLEMAREIVPDVILTDLMMPVMDGLQLCREIRADEVTNHIPMIVITAKVTDEDRVRGLEAGADAYLSKPFNSDELMVRIGKLLDQRRMLREKYAVGGESYKAEVANDSDGKFMMRVNDCINEMLGERERVDVNGLASRLCMSYSQFYRKVSALTGSTPAQYLQRVKVGLAQRLLVDNQEMSLNEIASACGFADYSSFVRAFRNITGSTPSQHIRDYSGSTSK